MNVLKGIASQVTLFGIGLGAFATASFFLAPSKLSAQPQAAQCYMIKSEDSPIADESIDKQEDNVQGKIWCWQELDEPTGAMMIYHVTPTGFTSPELSFIVDSNGMITHSSVLKGVRTVHQVHSTFNPLPVPLTPPEGAERVSQPQPMGTSSTGSAEKAFQILSTSTPSLSDISLQTEGSFTATVAPESIPWRGYWFPHKSGRMHNGTDSPMAKFDKYIAARTGAKPGAQKWEKEHHRFSGIPWAGHCNGWAAASIMYPEPSGPWTDPISGVSFTELDQKGLLMERAYCPELAFYGHRYRGRASDVRADIRPVDFHNALVYYLGELKKPVLMDMVSDEPVENRVISAYKMDVKKLAPHQFRVAATLTIHTYDNGPSDDLGPAQTLTRTYTYNIWTDEAGHAVKGSWLSSNPDFFWVPLTSGSCPEANPSVTDARVQTLGAPLDLPGW